VGDLLVIQRRRRSILYREILRDARFFELLLRIDREKCEEVRSRRCQKPGCGGPLQAGHFERKPRGLLQKGPEGFELRFDLCCGWCRRRTMPESVRFLGRKVYLGVVTVIASTLARGPNRDAIRLLQAQLQVSWNTVARWCRWWLELPGTSFWQRISGILPVDLGRDFLPDSLLARFIGDPAERLLQLMRLLGPLTARGLPSALGKSQ
jgi:hypothetical protein